MSLFVVVSFYNSCDDECEITRLNAGRPDFDSWLQQGFLATTTFRQPSLFIHPSVKCVRRALSPEIRRPVLEAEYSQPYNVAYLAVAFITFFHILLVLFCIVVYIVVCFVCFCLILYKYLLWILIVMYVLFRVFCFIVLFCVLLVCKCVLYYCHRVSTQLQLANIPYQYIIAIRIREVIPSLLHTSSWYDS